mgnify:CR=1 FL=1
METTRNDDDFSMLFLRAANEAEKLERISREQNAKKSIKKRPREEEPSEEDSGKRSKEACWHIPSSRVI